jgi:predicted RNase H-like nuclease (RuvC/YqgF family)
MDDTLDKKDQEIKTLKKELERLAEENSNFEIISKSHKEINGDLQNKLSAADLRIKELEVKLKEQLNQFRNKGEI